MDKKKDTKSVAMAAALEKANMEAGYDIPLAFAALNAITIQEQTDMRIPIFESQCDLTAMVDVVIRGSGGTLNDNGLAMLLNFAVAYGWHYAKSGESLVRSEAVLDKIMDWVDVSAKIPIAEKPQRKEAICKGFDALGNAVKRAIGKLRLQVAMKK